MEPYIINERVSIKDSKTIPGFDRYRQGLVISGLEERERNRFRAPKGVYSMIEDVWIYVISQDVDAIAECARAAIAQAAEPVKRPAGRRCMNCGATTGMLCPMSDNGEGPHEFEEE
jgi:hypothetical protein